MSSLRENIKLSLDNNLKKRDDIATSTLRLVLAAIKDGDIEFRTKKKGELMSDLDVLNLLQNMIKQRKESVNIYSKAGRIDLKKREEREIDIISSFLPKQITSSELEELIIRSISEIECTSIKDLGKLINHLKNKYPGQIDMKEVADLAKKNLK
jgi:hypothetical protein|tara:strand:+ start:623 stop:1084 length:462 start_codon:yes stop_codon:yes gene_type:complete